MKKKQRNHGMRQDKLYMTWNNVYQRCYNINLPSYSRYGGRGIIMSDEFKENPENFISYIKELKDYELRESLKLSLDRIDNDGNYEEGNLRWADDKTQCNNRRDKPNNTNQKGVHKRVGRYCASYYIGGKLYNVGSYKSLEAAVKAREAFIGNL